MRALPPHLNDLDRMAPGASRTQTAFISLDPSLPPDRTRVARRNGEVVRSLARLGHELQLFGPRIHEDATGLTDPAAVHELPLEPQCGPPGAEAWLALNTPLRRGLEALGQDHPSTGAVDLVYERRSRWSYAGLEWAHVRHIPSILQVDASVFDEVPVLGDPVQEEAARAIAHRAVAAASTTIATSEGVADWVRSLGVPDTHLHVVPEGADPERFAALATGAPASPERGLALTIGFVGRLSPWYGLPVLFQAFALLADRQSADRLLVVAAGPERPYFDQLALDLGIAAQVAWEPERTSDVSADCLARMDIVVAPYLSPVADRDGLGQLFEYMAASRPIIATCLPPIQAVLQHGRSAWLVRPDDPLGIAAAIGILRRSPVLRASMARHGYAAFRDRYTWNHVLQTILDYSRSDTEGVPSPETSHLGSRQELWAETAP